MQNDLFEQSPGNNPGKEVFSTQNYTNEPVQISAVFCSPAKTLNFPRHTDLNQLIPLFSDQIDSLLWINIDGIHDPQIIDRIGAELGIHALTLEDIMNSSQRPKIEFFKDHIYCVLKMLHFLPEEEEILIEQCSILTGKNYVITFQEESKNDIFTPIRKNLLQRGWEYARSGADFLTYALMDSIVDNYFVILEYISDRLEDMEEEIISKPTPEKLADLYSMKRKLISMRKSVWPLRELISRIQHEKPFLFKGETLIYVMDLYDHTIQIMDMIDTFRDIVSGLMDTYLSSINMQTNEIMKVLTIISTLFIPLTFITGLYGMNFDNMPELHWPAGYFIVLGIMGIILILMALYFKRKKWF